MVNKLTLFVLPGMFVSALTIGIQPAQGAAGSLDPAFGNRGVTVTSLTTASQNNGIVLFSVKLQTDGKILVFVNVDAPLTTSEVLRYTASGALGVERLNPDGTQDTSFGNSGLAIAGVGNRGLGVQFVVLVDPNTGNILVGGQLEPAGRRQPFQTVLARFNSAGQLDNTFGTQGVSIATGVGGCTALALLSSGGILVVNAQGIAQFNASGSVASTVTGGSIVASNGSNEPSTPSLFQSNGDLLFGGELFIGEESRGHNSSAEVLRFTATGGADSSFSDPTFHYVGSGGSGIEALVSGLALAPNADIVVVGSQVTFTQTGTTTMNGLARLTPAGTLDTTFGNGGTVANSVPAGTGGFDAVVVQPDGNIVVIGYINNFTGLSLSRYLGQ